MEKREPVMPDSFSFVYKRGPTSCHVPDLVEAFKSLIEPNTYPNFRMRRSNTLKDLIAISADLSVNFLVQFSSNGDGTNMHLIKTPHGPSLMFRLTNYTVDMLKFPMLKPPLTIVNGFSNSPEHQLCKETFKQLFPAIDISQQQDIDRIVVVNYSPATDCISIRHFKFLDLQGVDLGIYQLLQNPTCNLTSIDQLLQGQMDDKVQEIGPRIDMQLIRILGGLMKGEMMFHRHKDYKNIQNAAQLEQKAKHSARLQRKKEISDTIRKNERLKKKHELLERRGEQEIIREEKQAIKGLMTAEKEGFEHLIGEKGDGWKSKKEIAEEKKQEEARKLVKSKPESKDKK